MKILLIDHNDSFTQNLKHWLKDISNTVDVLNESKILASDFNTYIKNYDLLVLSPGPHSPQHYLRTLELLKHWPKNKLVLGVCLGAQCMAFVSGCEVKPYAPPFHGKTSLVTWNSLAENQTLTVARYHSLKIEPNDKFKCLIFSEHDHIPMVLENELSSWLGFQFHPESFLTAEPEFWKNLVVKKISDLKSSALSVDQLK